MANSFDVSLGKIERESVTEKVAAVLRSQIVSGALKPGTRLIESQLAEQLGVSRAPLREAFRILEPEGLLVLAPSGGTFVAEISEDDLREIYMVRSVLEGLAMRLVAERVTEGEVAELSHIVEQMKEAAERGAAGQVIELDLQFHERIWRFSRHRRLYEILSNMLGPIHMFLALNSQVYDDLVDNALEHVQIVDALSSEDAREADKIMVSHIEDAGKRNIAYVRSRKTLEAQVCHVWAVNGTG